MLLRRVLPIIMFLALAATAHAETPKTYIVKEGDTLWGISKRFIKDPFFWPNLWAENPKIPNPHLIYPGQKLYIYKDRIEVVAVAPEQPATEVEEAPAVEAVADVPVPLPVPEVTETIRIPQISTSFVTIKELADSGTLIDTVDERIMITDEDTVFVKMKNLAATRPGDKFTLFKVGEKVIHPATGQPVGHKVFNLGELEIIAIEKDVATAKIINVEREIERGARLRPYIEPLKQVELRVPQKQLRGYLLTSTNDRVTIGAYDVIYVDLGKEDDLAVGNALRLFRPRQGTKKGVQNQNVSLPDKQLGEAVVIEVRPRTATALVTKATDYIENGDRVITILE